MKFRALILFSISVVIRATATDDDSSHSEAKDQHSDDLVEEASSDIHVEHANQQSPVGTVIEAVAAHPMLEVVPDEGHNSRHPSTASRTISSDAEAETHSLPAVTHPIPENAGVEHRHTPSNPHDNVFHVEPAPGTLVEPGAEVVRAEPIDDSVEHSHELHTPSAPVLVDAIPAGLLSHIDDRVMHIENPVVATPVETESERDDMLEEVTADKESETPRDPLANSMQAVSHIVRHPLILPSIHILSARAFIRGSSRSVRRRASGPI
jgi:hypothetical protein